MRDWLEDGALDTPVFSVMDEDESEVDGLDVGLGEATYVAGDDDGDEDEDEDGW